MKMRAAFGYEVRVPQTSGWLQRVRAHDLTEVEIREIDRKELAPGFVAEVPAVDEWGAAHEIRLQRHRYHAFEGVLLHGCAASEPAPPDIRPGAYAGAAVWEAPAVPVSRFAEAAGRPDSRRWPPAGEFDWSFRPFEPSDTARTAAVDTRKPASRGLFDADRERSRAAGLAACLAEARRYVAAGDRVLRVAGEPCWTVSMSGPPRVVATCDHAAARDHSDGLRLPADRLEVAVEVCAAANRCHPRHVATIGRIECSVPARLRGDVLDAEHHLHEVLAAAGPLAAAADAGTLRAWLAAREFLLDHPDPKRMDVFREDAFAAEVAAHARGLAEMVREVRRAGTVDDSRCARADDILTAMRRRACAVPGWADLAARPALDAAEEAALGALA